MNIKNIWLIASHLLIHKLKNKGILLLLLVVCLIEVVINISGWNNYKKQNNIRTHHQNIERESWESNPDKHPHRMAHFGSFAFRLQHPLSVFDSGLENYTGNVVFLEAHKQNTANFSEASFSTGLMRFGDLNLAMILNLILPLILFFIGYDVISKEKEKQTLKILYLQGAKMKEILLGKALGLLGVITLFFIPSIVALWSLALLEEPNYGQETLFRISIITISYFIFFIVLCFFSTLISAKSNSSKESLLRLLGFWFFFFVVIPKTAQVVGGYVYPNPTRFTFRNNIEKDISKIGDSHNPNDPYFNNLKDSVLKANKVKSVSELPFNYGGFVMGKGEEITAKLYAKHQKKLIKAYQKQNKLTYSLGLINPYLAIKNISMSFSGTDFDTYNNFLLKTEDFRYKQSQLMNKLQMKFISSKAKGSEGKINVVSKDFWANAPTFKYVYLNVTNIIQKQLLSIISLCLWIFFLVFLTIRFSNKVKLI